MNIEINIIEGAPLQEQSQVFQAWFNENCIPNMTFGNGIDSIQTCSKFDEYNRPKEWLFDEIIVEAEYFTKDVNYTFNKFNIYARTI